MLVPSFIVCHAFKGTGSSRGKGSWPKFRCWHSKSILVSETFQRLKFLNAEHPHKRENQRRDQTSKLSIRNYCLHLSGNLMGNVGFSFKIWLFGNEKFLKKHSKIKSSYIESFSVSTQKHNWLVFLIFKGCLLYTNIRKNTVAKH